MENKVYLTPEKETNLIVAGRSIKKNDILMFIDCVFSFFSFI